MKNKKTVVIHQPDFMPYLGFFHRFLDADLYIALDHVQYVNSSRAWTNRDKIKTLQGEKWLTVSINKTSRETMINQVELSTSVNWRQNHFDLLKQNYENTAFYNEIFPKVEELYSLPFKMLSDFNIASIEMLMDMLDVKIPWILSSDLNPKGKKNDLLVDLLEKVSATHYVSGVGAIDYFDPEPFARSDIEIIWQKYVPVKYEQKFGDFIPYLTSLDLLFNHGIKTSRELLRRQE